MARHGDRIDQLSRTIESSRTRRNAAKLGVASALTALTAGLMPDHSAAAQLDEAGEISAQRRAPARCRRNGARCKKIVRQYCWNYYPNYYGTCTNQNLPCCGHYTRCKNGRAVDCLRRKGW